MALSDSQSASLVLLVGGIGLGFWWYRLDPMERSSFLAGKGKPSPIGPPQPAGVGRVVGPTYPFDQQSKAPVTGTPMQRLEAFAARWGLIVTSRIRKGNPKSFHYTGRAIDTSRGKTPRETAQIIADAIRSGFRILDENYTGQGPYGHSTGPHLHIEDRR